jgi:hypothetical protein
MSIFETNTNQYMTLSTTYQKQRTLSSDPQYFGAHLNMARHNVFLIHNYLAEKFGKKPLTDDDGIAGCFLTQKWNDKANYIYSILSSQLPITKVFDTAALPKVERETENFEQESINFDTLAATLKDLFKTINILRNDYSHYYAKRFETSGINRTVNIIYNLAVFLRENFARAIQYTKKRFEAVFEEKDFAHLINYELVTYNDELTDNGFVFFTCLFLEREAAFQFLSKIKGFKNTQTKSFLATREVFTAYCVNLPKEKMISDNPEQAIALDMMNYLNRCPKELFHALDEEDKKEFQPPLNTDKLQNIVENSTNDDFPYEDYETYIASITSKRRYEDRFPYFALHYLDNCESFKPEFQINLGKAIVNSYQKNILGETFTRDIVSNIKVFGKLKDFIIIEESKLKETLKAKINLNEAVDFTQYAPHYHVTDANKIALHFGGTKDAKKYYDSKLTTAQLSIHELPKLALLELLEKGKATTLIQEFIQKNSRQIYNLEFWKQLKEKFNYSELSRKFYNNKIENFDDDVANNLKAKNDLNSLKYWEYVREVNKRKVSLNKELEEVGLQVNQIPTKLIDYCLNISPIDKALQFKEYIKAELKDCKQRQKAIENRTAPRIGEMATYLAKDIVDYIISKEIKQKTTSFYYDKIQECIALFADVDKKDLFLKICEKELGLMDKTKGHPFLNQLNFTEIHKTGEFYKAYIEVKGLRTKKEIKTSYRENRVVEKQTPDNWLENTFYTKVKNEKTEKFDTKVISPTDIAIPYTIKKLTENEPTIEQWLSFVKNGNKQTDKDKPKAKAIDLPTNLFDNALVTLLKQKCNLPTTNNKKYNYSKLLQLWIADTQPYYNYKRAYIIYAGKPYETKVNFTPNTKPSFKDYFENKIDNCTALQNREREAQNRRGKKPPLQPLNYFDVLKVFNNDITENEKLIRFYQTKDAILKLILNEYYSKHQEMDIKLSEITPNAENSPLQKTIELKQLVEGKLYYDKEGNKDESGNRTVIARTIIANNRKRKDYGLFKKYVTDRRLPELFEYYEAENISLEAIEKQLKEYGVYKDLIFDKVFALEAHICNTINKDELQTAILDKSQWDNVEHKPYLDLLFKKQVINTQEFRFLEVVRNAVSHNQFPPQVVVNTSININMANSIMPQIHSAYETLVNNIIEKLK